MTLLAHFRVVPEPEKKSLYVRIFIFSSRSSMYAWRRVNRDHAASCFELDARIGRARHRSPAVAECNFALPDLTHGAIAHELGPAALRWAERMRLEPPIGTGVRCKGNRATDDEERLCWALDEMVTQFYRRAALANIPVSPCTPAP